jgi:hypothetical protein
VSAKLKTPPPHPTHLPAPQAELAATLDRPRRDHVVVLASRPRREFGGPCALGDASAQELWQSNTMECRPFKDAAYDLKRQQLDGAVQAVAAVAEVAVQVGGWVRGGVRQQGCAGGRGWVQAVAEVAAGAGGWVRWWVGRHSLYRRVPGGACTTAMEQQRTN